MKPYTEYKLTEYDWLGSIPTHWQWLYLSQTCREQKIKNTNNIETNVLSLSYGRIIRKKNINSGLFPKDYATYQIVSSGNIILRLTDLQNDKRSLRTGLVNERGIITSAYTCLAPFENADYLQFLLHAYDIQKYFYGLGGGVRQSIGYDDIRYMMVPLPPRQEQDQIVNFLNWKVSEVSQLICSKRKQLALIREVIYTLTSTAIESDDVMHHRLRNITEPCGRMIIRDPETEYNPIGLLNRGRGIFHKESTNGINLGDSDFFIVEDNALIFSGQFAWEGSVALTNKDVEGCVASHRYHMIRANSDVVTNEFLWAFFQTKKGDLLLNTHSRGGAGRNRPLNMNTLRKEIIPVPSMGLQETISKEVRMYFQYVNEIKTLESILLEYRTRIISDVVTGKVDVRNVEVPEFIVEDAVKENCDEEATDEVPDEEVEENADD